MRCGPWVVDIGVVGITNALEEAWKEAHGIEHASWSSDVSMDGEGWRYCMWSAPAGKLGLV